MTEPMTPSRRRSLAEIKRNIETAGFHIYIVSGQETPRFAYTIGLQESFGAELVLAGAAFYDNDEVLEIVHSVRKQLAKPQKGKNGPPWHSDFSMRRLGSFTLGKVHASWARSLLLGALDYYSVEDVDAYQILPDRNHRTIDVPNMALAWSTNREPAWQWLHDDWQHPVPSDSEVMTDVAALRGAKIVRACRWELDYWEMFASSESDIRKSEARLVPLGCLLATDPSLSPVVDLAVGDCLWRDDEGVWNRK